MAVVLNKKLDEHPNIRGWLVKTAKNVTCEFNRNKRKIMEDSVEWIEELAHSKGFTDSLFEKMELERLKEQNYVARIMESDLLNDGDVIFFNMLIGGLTDEQIGDILVLTKGAIAVRRSRLRMKVKKILSEM
jgi:DNA-directed RNA polymerase specialized sigma24 family protein